MILVGRDCITEILAPQGMELPKRGLLKRWQLRREHEEELRLRGRFVYQMSFQVEQMPMAEYLQLEAELRASSLEHGVFRGFAGRATAGESSSTMRWQPGEAPFAYALPESRSDAFLLQTFHGFPAEHTILKVQTVVDVSSA
jgi:hypothetical protein